MKTICLSLGALLLIACCCDAMPQAVQYNTAPVTCCYRFGTFRIPIHLVSDIKKTDNSCMRKGFIVTTAKGRAICFSQFSQWALNTYNQIHKPEGSGLQQ